MRPTLTHSLEVLGIGGGLRQPPFPFCILSEKCRRGKIVRSPLALSMISTRGESGVVQLKV